MDRETERRRTRTWNRLVREGPGPDWVSCALWALAICPHDCQGTSRSCTGTRLDVDEDQADEGP